MKQTILGLFLLCASSMVLGQQRMVSGKVLTEAATPITGATIFVKQLHEYALSDSLGNFVLMVQDNNISLEVSHVGFASQFLTLPKEQNSVI